MDLISKIKMSTMSPTKFFNGIKSEKGLVEAFKYYAILSLINLVVTLIEIFSGLSYLSSYGAGLGIATPIAVYLVGLVGSFIGAGILHIFISLLGGKQGFYNTYKAAIYASTPSLLLGWIPYVGVIIGIYSLYLLVKGVSILQKMTMKRAFVAAVLIPVVIAILIAAISAGLIYFYLGSVPNAVFPA